MIEKAYLFGLQAHRLQLLASPQWAQIIPNTRDSFFSGVMLAGVARELGEGLASRGWQSTHTTTQGP